MRSLYTTILCSKSHKLAALFLAEFHAALKSWIKTREKKEYETDIIKEDITEITAAVSITIIYVNIDLLHFLVAYEQTVSALHLNQIDLHHDSYLND